MQLLWILIEWAAILFALIWICVRLALGCLYLFAGIGWLTASVYRMFRGHSPKGWEHVIASPACDRSTDMTHP